MSTKIERRQLILSTMAAWAAMPGCDRIDVKITGAPDGVEVTGDGMVFLSPVTDTEDFYVYQSGPQPQVDPDTWRLIIKNRGEEVLSISQADLLAMESEQVELTLQCIGSRPSHRNIGNAVWGGLPLSELIAALGGPEPQESCVELHLIGADAYDASIPVEDYYGAPVWVIWEMNGEPLSFDHGAPARLLVPGRYGIKNLKWIEEINYSDTVIEAFWDLSGWSHLAPYLVNGFIMVPTFGETVTPPVTVLGTAFAGSDQVARVEFTDDGGATWADCEIDYNPGPNIWALWRMEWSPAPGSWEIQVRVTTQSGAVTVMDPNGTNQYNGYDAGMLIALEVE
ncbi:MAG: molybdopterin-dependent oxidoreductase [Rhodobacterales bacterium]|nr:molybdopterin-dependent oxidoreductase [Rhodobacterales bacterium]